MKKVNLRLVAPTKRYTVKELATKLGYSLRSIRNMVYNGLPTFDVVDGKVKYKISGFEFVEYIKRRRKMEKIGPIEPDQMCCFKCGKPQIPLDRKIRINDFSNQTDKKVNAGVIDLIGVCPECGFAIHRLDNVRNLELIKSKFSVAD